MAGNPPLSGIKVLELAGLAPGPFAGQMLADAGASVLRVDRCPSSPSPPSHDAPTDPLARHKSSIAVDLKTAPGQALIRRLCLSIDVLIDPFRPGVLERLNLGPAQLLAANPRLIYARLTGFRRDGRYSAMAGHDINYLSVSGVLDMLGRADERPHAPLNLLADFAGGGAMLVHGVLLALLARARSGLGQLVEANMVDGSSYLAAYPRATQRRRPRGRNLLDGGAPFYDTYATADGGHVAVGALEPRFFRRLVRGLGLQGEAAAGGDWDKYRADPQNWAPIRQLFAGVFLSRPRRHWESVFDGTDACVTPVLSYSELALHPDRGGDQRPAVALADTPCRPLHGHDDEAYQGTCLKPGHGGQQLLESWLGWRDGVEYHVDKAGGLVLKDDVAPVKPSKL